MSVQKVIDAIREYVNVMISQRTPKGYTGVWVSAEAVDSSLSQVVVDGQTWRFVPKLESVTGLVANDKVMIVKFPGLPATIIGVMVGNVTLASQ